MNAYELKQYIINNDLTDVVIEKLGFHKIKDYKHEYRCALPDDNDSSQVVIKKDNLYCIIYRTDESFKGDIIDLVIDIKKVDFIKSIIMLHDIVGIKYEFNKKSGKKKQDHLSLMKSIRRKSKQYDYEDKTYDISILDNYVAHPTHYLLKEQGIGVKAQEYFDIHYDPFRERVLYPYFDTDNNNMLSGIMGRTTIKGFESLGLPKYFPIAKVSKRSALFGMMQNRRDINAEGKLIIFEAENSVLKAWQMGYKHSLALGHHEITNEHIQKLLSLSINEVIIAFDKDIGEEFLQKTAKPLNKYFNVSYINDEYDLLGKKDSPVDKGYKVFNFLYKHRVNYKGE